MTEDEEIRAGDRARAELAQTEDAFRRLRTAAMEELIATTPDQTAKRERLIVTCQIIDAVRKALFDTAQGAVMARAALAQQDLLRR